MCRIERPRSELAELDAVWHDGHIAFSAHTCCSTATLAAGTAPWTSCGSTWSKMRKPGIDRCGVLSWRLYALNSL